MQYMGSKRRLAKHLLPIMLAERTPDQWWVEAFVGGANMIEKVGGPRIGNDNHEYLIALLTAARDGYVPPTDISEELYRSIKNNPAGYPKELVGFVGFVCSFGGKWWAGYARNARGDNYAKSGSNSLCKQALKLDGVNFTCGSYLDLVIPPNSLIYCDPPYDGTTTYSTKAFDHEEFWQWCRVKTGQGHTVFISEYNAPDDFECVLKVELYAQLDRYNNKATKIERLFRHRQPQI
jgi:DNA adenine methylase